MKRLIASEDMVRTFEVGPSNLYPKSTLRSDTLYRDIVEKLDEEFERKAKVKNVQVFYDPRYSCTYAFTADVYYRNKKGSVNRTLDYDDIEKICRTCRYSKDVSTRVVAFILDSFKEQVKHEKARLKNS